MKTLLEKLVLTSFSELLGRFAAQLSPFESDTSAVLIPASVSAYLD